MHKNQRLHLVEPTTPHWVWALQTRAIYFFQVFVFLARVYFDQSACGVCGLHLDHWLGLYQILLRVGFVWCDHIVCSDGLRVSENDKRSARLYARRRTGQTHVLSPRRFGNGSKHQQFSNFEQLEVGYLFLLALFCILFAGIGCVLDHGYFLQQRVQHYRWSRLCYPLQFAHRAFWFDAAWVSIQHDTLGLALSTFELNRNDAVYDRYGAISGHPKCTCLLAYGLESLASKSTRCLLCFLSRYDVDICSYVVIDTKSKTASI